MKTKKFYYITVKETIEFESIYLVQANSKKAARADYKEGEADKMETDCGTFIKDKIVKIEISKQ